MAGAGEGGGVEDSSDSDSEGENLELICPSLIQELRNVLDEYPDDGQIFKELIQNAEDAGATTVKILTDTRCFNREWESSVLQKHPRLKFFQAPALCVYNDALFADQDWEGIRMLHTSIKEKDPLKVGRFGLGFKSVFHLTDRLVVLSGQYLMYMDPFKAKDDYCKRTRLAGRKGKELESLVKSLAGAFGVEPDTFTGSQGFNGTLFWFPLRQESSALSSTMYSTDKVHDLFMAFKAEAPSLLLFLNSIQHVSIYSRNDIHGPEELFRVGLASSCFQKVCKQRKQFVSAIKRAGKDLPTKELYCAAEMTIEVTDYALAQSSPGQEGCCSKSTGEGQNSASVSKKSVLTARGDSSETVEKTVQRQQWLVVSHHSAQGFLSQELSELCADPELSYRPYVGVAVPLTLTGRFQSQVFCFLPMPLDTRSPTGLPVHVHGFFALSQNRRHLKWPTADQLKHQAHLEPPLRWNCLLVQELLPRVYAAMLDRLKILHTSHPEEFYKAWPDMSKTDDRWRSLLHPLFKALSNKPFFYSHVQGGKWIHLSKAVLEQFSLDLPEEVKMAVVKVYSISGQRLVRLPKHVHSTMKDLRLLDSVEAVNVHCLCRLLPKTLHRLSHQEKLQVLHFICCQEEASDVLLNQELLPLGNGAFGVFGQRRDEASAIYWCRKDLVQLFPGIEYRFCETELDAVVEKKLSQLAKSGLFCLRTLENDDEVIPNLMQQSLAQESTERKLHDDSWVECVWTFLAASRPILDPFKHLTILPSPGADGCATLLPLSGVYVSSSASGMSSLSPDMVSCLTKLKVTVLSNLPKCIVKHEDVLGRWIQCPSEKGLLAALNHINGNAKLCETAVQQFNMNASSKEKESMLTLLNDMKEHPLDMFQRLQLFTEISTARAVSVADVPLIAPQALPSEILQILSLLRQIELLKCSASQRNVANILGAKEITVQEIVIKVVKMVKARDIQISEAEFLKFMKFVLGNEMLTKDTILQNLLCNMKIVPNKSGELKLASDLYNPDSFLLQQLFLGEDLFPKLDFIDPVRLKMLKSLGLREETDVLSSHIIATAKYIESLFVQERERDCCLKKANGLLKFLEDHGHKLDRNTLREISSIQCLPSLQEMDVQEYYPRSVPLKSTPLLVKPHTMCFLSEAPLVGSVLPILPKRIPSDVATELNIGSQVDVQHVLQNLDDILKHYQSRETAQYRLVFKEIFCFLSGHIADPLVVRTIKEKDCVLTMSADSFAKPNAFWIETKDEDILLQPFKYPLPSELKTAKELFLACGAEEHQNSNFFQSLLHGIKDYHLTHSCSDSKYSYDFALVRQILEILKKDPSMSNGTVLLPIHHNDLNVLRFCEAKDCTVVSKDGLFSADEDEEITAVHRDVHPETAVALGALKMEQRALTDVEDYDYEQHQEMSTWIHNLLMDSYVDGFSVPKELIQNADDAGATEVCFLLDERENADAMQNLISDSMATLQGPALVAYNNKTFSDKDFQNIIRVGEGTKKDDASKIGRFGQGFNSVYNLTEVPSFISRKTMAIFDPQKKYLKNGKGLKLDFQRKKNCALLSRMPGQFKPYQNVFGCKLEKEGDNYFNGTLFRFPFRTEEQAASSLIKNESYSAEKRRKFLTLLLEKAGSLLLFTQNVKTLKVFHLSRDANDPAQRVCLLDLSKTSHFKILSPCVQSENQTVVQYVTSHWNTKKDIKVVENSQIQMTLTKNAMSICKLEAHKSNTHWRIAWASGVDESAKMVEHFPNETLLPLSAVATLIEDDSLLSIRNSPKGFYTTGHLFCFLPLPDVDEHSSFPVHINAMFALTSSRRNLLMHSKDDLGNEKADWNSALLADAIARAYLLLLEVVHIEAANDLKTFYDLWPVPDHPDLMKGFLKRLATDGNKVLPVYGNQWVSFKEAWFLAPSFRNSSCGDIAVNVLQNFWNKEGHLVDTPTDTCVSLNILIEDIDMAYQTKVISECEFFRDIFFPNIDNIEQTDCDRLVHYALQQNCCKLNELLKENSCIPCAVTHTRKQPRELIDPEGAAAKLYLPSDGYFPQGSQTVDSQQGSVNFCSWECLQSLRKLGMITDKLSWEMIIERAQSVKDLFKSNTCDQTASKLRAYNIISHISGTMGNCPLNVQNILSKTEFLPVMNKPKDWPLPWAAEGLSNARGLAAPCELFAPNLQYLVCCHGLIVDHGLSGASYWSHFAVLKSLGVQTKEDASSHRLFEVSKMQLQILSVEKGLSKQDSLIRKICRSLYSYLTKCINQGGEDIEEDMLSDLKGKDIIWVGNRFVDPSRVAFQMCSNLEPYRFQLAQEFQSYKVLFMAVGVTEELGISNLMSLLEELYEVFKGKSLPDNIITLASGAAQQLAKCISHAGESCRSLCYPLFLPDSKNFMRSTKNLCIDDCEWLKETEAMKFVSRKIAPETAQVLGVVSKRRHDMMSLTEAIPFGQHEELTDRISRLLEGYTFDSALFKELLQNADDAGATEVKFFKDSRVLKQKQVPEGWEKLQGPSLCVFNNKSFTKDDMKGIRSLGRGSKGQDALKIGKYGVGFNAVYHLTDVPSFWTREDDDKEVLCAFDPNCKYVGIGGEPGIKFTDVDRLRDSYPDMLSGYLGSTVNTSEPGTLFRLPLRTEEMAKISQLKKQPVTIEEVAKHLDEFKKDMGSCLLFLNNVRKIGIYVVKDSGEVELQSEVRADMDKVNRDCMEQFKQELTWASRTAQDPAASLTDIHYFEAAVQLTLNHSHDRQEKWLIVHKVGLEEKDGISEHLRVHWSKENFRLLPRGGVAVKLAESEQKQSPLVHKKSCQAFCMLPLPVVTGLPMHVNGHFILDSETRRNLWQNEEGKSDVKTEWNELIISNIIVPAYIRALHIVKENWFTTESVGNYAQHLESYNKLFPELNLGSVTSSFWENMVKKVYQQIARKEEVLFPVLNTTQSVQEWMPAVKENGITGYFDDVEQKYFQNLCDSTKRRPVILSQGVQQQQTSQKDDELIKRKVSELKTVLADVNMKILAVPYYVYENFINIEEERVRDISPKNVALFLKTIGLDNDGYCNVSGLPKPVSNTTLKTVNNVKTLLNFLKLEPSVLCDLQNLPLCLRQSEILYRFCKKEGKVIISEFFSLLPGSADMFINNEIVDIIKSVCGTDGHFFTGFNIPLLAKLLPHSLSRDFCSPGSTCTVEKFPSSQWLKTLWKFLGKNISNETVSDHFFGKAWEALSVLQEWNFVPVIQRLGDRTRMQLYPIRDVHKVLFLPNKPDDRSTHHDLWDVLQTQCLPLLDTRLLPPCSIATKLVACMEHPSALLKALDYNANCLQLQKSQAFTILQYFCNTLCSGYAHQTNVTQKLKRLPGYAHQTNVAQKLKRLPLYVSVGGELTDIANKDVLCLDQSSVCSDGLREWAQNRGIVLLEQGWLPDSIFAFLSLKKAPDFYCKNLLPTLSSLPKKHVFAQMEFLKNNLCLFDKCKKSFTEQMQHVKFVEVNGTLFTADHFFSPHVEVFHTLCKPSSFPPDPYCKKDWKSFMIMAGMINSVTDDMFIEFAHAVEAEGKLGLTEATMGKSVVLVRHFLRHCVSKDDLVCRVKNVCFLYPSEWPETEEGKVLCKIVNPFCKGQLVSFAQSCLADKLFIVWSTCCVLHPDTVPTVPRLLNLEIFGILERGALKENVIEHLKNLCKQLTNQDLDLFETAGVKNVLKKVMVALYEYLDQNCDEDDIKRLKAIPIICDLENNQMLKVENVVIDLREEEAICGYIQKAPIYFGQFFDFFERLGVSKCVAVNHYAAVLSSLKEHAGENELHVEELKVVQKAVQGLFKCLDAERSKTEQISMDPIFLPSISKRLIESSQLIFCDHVGLEIRFQEIHKEMPQEMPFFIGFGKLDMKADPIATPKLLPERHQMKMLSQVVKEMIPEEVKGRAEMGLHSTEIDQLLRSQNFLSVLARLAYFYHHRNAKPFPENAEEQISQDLQNICVKETEDLATDLVWAESRKPIDKTRKRKRAFVDQSSCSKSKRLCTVYLDRNVCESEGINSGSIQKSLMYAIEHSVTIPMYKDYLLDALKSPKEAESEMDEDGVPIISSRTSEPVFPPPGTYIPIRLHCYLDNSFSSFNEGEHVGFEVYDPQVDEEDSEQNDPVYAYAIIMKEVTSGGESQLVKRYRINLGPEWGIRDVSVTQLYKFIRKTEQQQEMSSRHVMEYEGQTSPNAAFQVRDGTSALNLKSILKKIRQILREAWQNLDEKDQNRVVKRLYLKWHPDKNVENQELCTKIVQRLQYYVYLLKQGSKLPDDENDEEDAVDGTRRSGSYSSWRPSFFEKMNRRSRSYRDSFRSNASSSGNRKRGSNRRFEEGYAHFHDRSANPQPGEGRRWYRQAEADLRAARSATENSSTGYNWICFQCHQAVEKGLKAVLYTRDSNHIDLKNHSLRTLSSSVGDNNIKSLACKLESQVGNHMRMRYPDMFCYPKIPGEVYTSDDARPACEIAAEVLEKVKAVIERE